MSDTEQSKRPKTKVAKNVECGDWCEFGGVAVMAGQPVYNDMGNILIPWGNGSVSEFRPNERIRMHYDD